MKEVGRCCSCMEVQSSSMKQFTRRNSQRQPGFEHHGIFNCMSAPNCDSQESQGPALSSCPEDPQSFPDENQPLTGAQLGELISVHGLQSNDNVTATTLMPAPARSCSLPKRAKVEGVDTSSKRKACTATRCTIPGSKLAASGASPPQTYAEASTDLLLRAASALAESSSSILQPGHAQGHEAKITKKVGTMSGGSGSGSGRTASSSGHKRHTGVTPAAIDLSASEGNRAAAAGGCRPATQQQQQQAPAAPVSVPTPRRPAKLIPTGVLEASPVEARPAQTVMEAQERGELVQMQDDARYAMDGLVTSCSTDIQRQSAVALTEMLCSRKGRLALRADGLAQQVLSSLAKLKPAKDSVLGLASTIILLMLTSEDAHPAYLASVAAAVLFDQLLQKDYTFQATADSCTQGGKLVRMLKSRPLCGLVASVGVTGQRDLLLLTLEQATSSQQASKVAAVERLKHNLRQYGALTRLGKLVAEEAEEAASAARQLRLLLLVLENATFTCQANGQALAQLQVAAAPNPCHITSSQDGLQQPFPEVLVQTADRLLAAGDQRDCQQALHVCLSVLMNLSHQNPDGAAVIAAAGGMQAAAALIGMLLGPAQHSHQELCKQVLEHLELVSVALGLLINLVSGEPANSRQLAHTAADISSRQDTAAHSSGSLVTLLCSVMTAVGELLQQAAVHEGRDAAVDVRRKALPADSRCSAAGSDLQDESSAGEASIVEAYCAMLLGFLVRDCQDVSQCVPQMLEGQSLQPIMEAVQRCLNFYISTGAITDHTKNTLEDLLEHLRKCM